MKYRPVIGLETHIQLNTVTKLMCACRNEYTPDEPNKHICEFCTGQPGALPTVNQEAVRKAIRLGVALRSSIPEITSFDRKNYFYPDLPNGYQISQYHEPIVNGGILQFYIQNNETGEWNESSVSITRAHLETDAAKLIHAGGKTMVDFNRSGAPLIEIVTDPVIQSKEQAMGYVEELQLLVRTLEIADADMEKGQMRFDINISLQTEEQVAQNVLPAYRVEIKNVNSIRSLGRVIAYEIDRQTQLLNSNTIPAQETRGWDDDKGVSEAQRSKEDAMDYRYFPEPDLLPIAITSSDIPNFESLRELPEKRRDRYLKDGIPLQSAVLMTKNSLMGNLYDTVQTLNSEQSTSLNHTIANIITVLLPPIAEEKNIPLSALLSASNILQLAQYFNSSKISNTGLSKAITILLGEPDKDVGNILATHQLLQVNDDSILEAFVEVILKANPQVAEEIRGGKLQAVGYLVGLCMKESKGSGNPQKFAEIIKKRLVP